MHPKYQEVIQLRKRGKSYREIARAVGISKNSVSRWCKNLKLPLSTQIILEKKSKYPKEKFAEYNRLKAKRVQIENRKIKKDSAGEIRPLSKYELRLIGTALYWAEGRKKWPQNDQRLQFVNSDPAMVALFLRFLREVIGVSEEKLKVSIRIHPNIDAKSTINFWSRITDIPKERFRITTQISRASQGKRPKNSLPYGTLHLRVNRRQKFFQIKGWIDGIIKQSS